MKLLPARIKFPKVNWMRFFGGVWPWIGGGVFVGLALMDVLDRHYLTAWVSAVLALVLFLDAKKWGFWVEQRTRLESQLHTTNGALHASALATKAALKAENFDAIVTIADMNEMLAQAYLLGRSDFSVEVGADDAG